MSAVIGFAWSVVLAAGGASAPVNPPAGVATSADRLVREVESEATRLRAELALAQGPDFYLRLDARARRLALVLRGVPLEEHELDAFETGRPRVLFWKRPLAPDWDLRSYGGGRLEPSRQHDRVEIQAPVPSPTGDEAALEPSPPAIPPTAEEAYSVPSRYRILFDGGMSVEVVARGGGRNRPWPRRAWDAIRLRLDDLSEVLGGSENADVRIRLRMAPEDEE